MDPTEAGQCCGWPLPRPEPLMTQAHRWQQATVLVLREFDASRLPRYERAALKAGRALAPRPDLIQYGGDTGPDADACVYALSAFWLARLGHPAGVARDAEVHGAFFADPACTELICRTLVAPPDGARVRQHHVVDPAGDLVGTIDRVPGRNRFVRHTWRLRQPGRPELSAGRVTVRGVRDATITSAFGLAAGLVTELVLGSGGGEGGGSGQGPRTLQWWTTGVRPAQKALTSSEECLPDRPWRVWVDWLDRRLVFAQMLIGDR